MQKMAFEQESVNIDYTKLLGFGDIAAFGSDTAKVKWILDETHNKIGEVPHNKIGE